VASRGVQLGRDKILTAKPSDRHRHPTFLFPMIVDPRGLADLPTDRHYLKPFVLVDQVAGVEVRAPKQVGFDRASGDRIFVQKTINALTGESTVRYRPESLNQFFD